MKLSILSFLAFAASTITVTASMVADLGYNDEQVDDSDWKIQALIRDNDALTIDNDALIQELDAMKNEIEGLKHTILLDKEREVSTSGRKLRPKSGKGGNGGGAPSVVPTLPACPVRIMCLFAHNQSLCYCLVVPASHPFTILLFFFDSQSIVSFLLDCK
jgi:hypothetical protein